MQEEKKHEKRELSQVNMEQINEMNGPRRRREAKRQRTMKSSFNHTVSRIIRWGVAIVLKNNRANT